MKKVVITEEQLSNITENLITEGSEYPCAMGFGTAVDVAINQEGIQPIFVKAALGVLGRESNFGAVMGIWKRSY